MVLLHFRWILRRLDNETDLALTSFPSIRKPKNIQNITKNNKKFITFSFCHRAVVKKEDYMPNFLSNVNTVLWCSHCKIYQWGSTPVCFLSITYIVVPDCGLVRLVNFPFKTKSILFRVSKSIIKFHLSLRCGWDKIIFWNSWYCMYTYCKWYTGKVQAPFCAAAYSRIHLSFRCRWDKIIFWISWYSMYTYIKWCIGKVQAPFCDAASLQNPL